MQRSGIQTGGGQQVFDHASQISRLGHDQPDQLRRHLRLLDLRFLFEEHRQPMDTGEGRPKFMRGVGDELFTGMADVPLSL